MSATDFLIDAITSHQIYLQRYAGSANKEISKGLRQLSEQVIEMLGSAAHVSDLVEIRARIRRILASTEISAELDRISQDLPEYEVLFFQQLLGQASIGAVNLLAPDSVAAIVTQAPMTLTSTTGKVTRLIIDHAVEQFIEKAQDSVINVIRGGVAEGSSVQSIARGVNSVVNQRTRRQ